MRFHYREKTAYSRKKIENGFHSQENIFSVKIDSP